MNLALRSLQKRTLTAGQGDEGEDQNLLRGTIVTNDTPTSRWPVTRFDGYDEVRLEDEEHGLLVFISRNDTENYWRVEFNFQNASAYNSSKEEQVAAARLMQETARCVLELNGEQVAA